jgi:Response regulator containing CheY-like receiver, AAA-type ATPase, and DNA-binding domains
MMAAFSMLQSIHRMSQIAIPSEAPPAESIPSSDSVLSPLRVHTPDENSASAGNKKVLLLEDDPAFKEIMTVFLGETGFKVVAVQNGVEGVHQVLAGDFEVILCDMMMPTLPGDMFFRAVERMRPHLCDRFIFMTGHRNNSKVNDFIGNVNGTILTKPFHVDDLLEMIAFIQIRTHLLAA